MLALPKGSLKKTTFQASPPLQKIINIKKLVVETVYLAITLYFILNCISANT